MPSHAQNPVIYTPASSLTVSGGQTEGMIRQSAIVKLTPNICASRMIAKPHTSSAVHHHGDQDTVVFAHKGKGVIVSEGGKKRVVVEEGGFALIPAFAEHQEVNESEEDVVWAIIRAPGDEPVVVNLEKGWGSS
ncbi:hypothetical protein B0A48_13271 [Cryoendolithus antarcticus]|uniref:Cupin type-2 domain-containing protein n=1 Tax=Cryoendolithus antarcticus TaxID=1507870 RepID=A0A1V8SPS2_9PEZI|nr:hypothetical protein B0A48_13271 [Cryoendolithus antarcticus]